MKRTALALSLLILSGCGASTLTSRQVVTNTITAYETTSSPQTMPVVFVGTIDGTQQFVFYHMYYYIQGQWVLVGTEQNDQPTLPSHPKAR